MVTNPSTTVKICGLMTMDLIDGLQGLSIDQVGFVFAASRRQVTPERAKELILRLKQTFNKDCCPLTVGVFVDPTIEHLTEVLSIAPLDVIQLHGNEDATFCKQVKALFGTKVYKVVSIGQGEGAIEATKAYLHAFPSVVDAILLDTAGGGTGKTFDWSVIPSYLDWAREACIPLIIAGGLEPENVTVLVQTYRPDGVDVSSGVETDGKKDLDKIKMFVERVKSV